MLNYEKWKKLNESFMMSSPIGGITHNNGFLAYSPLSEAEMDRDEDEDMEDEDMEDEDMEDEDMEDEDMEDEDMEDEDMEDEDIEDEDIEDEDMEDEDMEDEDEMDDEDDMEMEIQDDAGEIEEIEDGDELEDSDDGAVHHHHHHYHGHKNKEAYSDDADEEAGNEMMCKRCGSYMANENHDCGIDEWAASVKSLINPVILQKLNGSILTEASYKGAKIDIEPGETDGALDLKAKLEALIKGIKSKTDMPDRQRYSILNSIIKVLVPTDRVAEFQKLAKMEKTSILKSEPKETEEKMSKGRVSRKKSAPCKKCSTSMKFMPTKSGKYAGKKMKKK